MTKEQGYPEPTPISPEAERGHYVVFDQALWACKALWRHEEATHHDTSSSINGSPTVLHHYSQSLDDRHLQLFHIQPATEAYRILMRVLSLDIINEVFIRL